MIADAVDRFLSSGGKVQQVAGFEYKPLPEYKPPKKRVLKVKRKSANQVDREFIATGAGFSSAASMRAKLYAVFMPKPLKARGPGGKHLYDRDEALEAIEKIKAARRVFAQAPKDVDAALHEYACYALSQDRGGWIMLHPRRRLE
jgi:hypothetical protein